MQFNPTQIYRPPEFFSGPLEELVRVHESQVKNLWYIIYIIFYKVYIMRHSVCVHVIKMNLNKKVTKHYSCA